MNEDDTRSIRSTAGDDAPPTSPVRGFLAELTFCLPDLPDVRDFAAVHALRGGMAQERLADFLVAVNEVATNAVTHGHATAKALLRMWTTSDSLVVEVRDEGRWALPAAPGQTPPAAYATSGMGLWVARMVSSAIDFKTGLDGTVVTMSFAV
ncbi:ATP-binding protein [Planomonospora sp. ID67723]|uniref:ATP-binding protein n=1 Tax=Planomonospora sp. ID67723 TaxID=2738134 RepID=UPI0027DD0795|nr:ATP-binding protein [Planomonospora sp. ID67723]